MKQQVEEQIDEQFFVSIVSQHSSKLLHRALYLTRDREHAEDLVQDVFVDLWERRHRLEIKTSLSAYLQTSLKHKFLRKVSRDQLHEQAMDYLVRKMNQIETTVLDVMAANDLQATLTEVIDQLPENMKKIFMLRHEDYSLREIAQALGLAEQTVKSYHAEIKRRIREAVLLKHPDISHSILLLLFVRLIEK